MIAFVFEEYSESFRFHLIVILWLLTREVFDVLKKYPFLILSIASSVRKQSLHSLIT